MSIATEPFLTVLPPDPTALAEKDQVTFAAICAEVEAVDSVREAREKNETTTDRVVKLKHAHSLMNARCAALFEHIAAVRDKLDTGLVDQYAGGGAPVDAAALILDLTAAQGERDALMRALARLVQHVTPLATIAQMKAEAALFSGRADQLKRIANDRIARTAELLRGAAEFESGLTIDTRSTLSGFILGYAEELAARSNELSLAVIEQQRIYQRMNAVS
ncbi:MAG: hypothetical protein ABSH56_11900 [Bryobacteraceae bacterium]|jgi:hypothetical protein